MVNRYFDPVNFVLSLLIVIVSFIMINQYGFVTEAVSGESMSPTFRNGEKLIASRNLDLKRGDVVVFEAPNQKDKFYIKRIIGMPGDKLQYEDDKLYINGKYIAEPYLTANKKQFGAGTQITKDFALENLPATNRATVPKDSYFVLGDNRSISNDSRYFGFINKKSIKGKVVVRYWPLSNFQYFGGE